MKERGKFDTSVTVGMVTVIAGISMTNVSAFSAMESAAGSKMNCDG